MAFYLALYLPKNPRDLARAGQAHTVTSFLGEPWPVAISFVFGSQTREQICNNDPPKKKYRITAISDALWKHFKLILGNILCPHVSSSPHVVLEY